jgi:DNA-binding transcriptional LysR family regulator
MKIDPHLLEILAAIADHGGLTEGAAALGKSQPSLSRSMAQLEARIGAPLFLPGRRPLQPTELGALLADEGRRIRRATAAAAGAVTLYRAGRAGAVRIGGTPLFMDGVIAGMVAGFQSLHPEVRIDQSYGYAADLADRLATGALDLAVCPIHPDDVPPGLVFDRILPGRNVIACRIGHPLARRKGLRARDMARFPWIAPPVESPLHQDLQQVLAGLGPEDFRISFSGGSLSAVLGILTASDCLAILPYSVVFTLRRQFGILALPLRIQHPARDLGLLHAPGGAARPVARRLRAHVLSQFEVLSATIQHHEKNALWRG